MCDNSVGENVEKNPLYTVKLAQLLWTTLYFKRKKEGKEGEGKKEKNDLSQQFKELKFTYQRNICYKCENVKNEIFPFKNKSCIIFSKAICLLLCSLYNYLQ